MNPKHLNYRKEPYDHHFRLAERQETGRILHHLKNNIEDPKIPNFDRVSWKLQHIGTAPGSGKVRDGEDLWPSTRSAEWLTIVV